LHQLPNVSVSVRNKILVNIMARPPRRVSGGHRQATHHRLGSKAGHVAHMDDSVLLGHGFRRVRKVAKSDC